MFRLVMHKSGLMGTVFGYSKCYSIWPRDKNKKLKKRYFFTQMAYTSKPRDKRLLLLQILVTEN